MMVAEDFPLLIPDGTAPITTLFVRSSSAGSIQGQSNEGAIIEGLVALGLTHGGDDGLACNRRVESLREVSERIVAEAAGHAQGACPQTHQGFNGRESPTTQ